ncbi:MAG: serpin family protein [bacterium]|nr:serpin family protein [bacterium]
MKSIYLFISFLLLITLLGQLSIPNNALASKDVSTLVSGNNSFALELYKRLAIEKGNIFYSPYSISSALAMTYAGAKGETAKQMAKVLRFTLPQERLHQTFNELSRLLQSNTKDYQLSIANALWGQKDYKFLKEFIDLTNKYYEAGFKEVDYINTKAREEARQMINKWVEDKTNGKIKDIIKTDDIDELTRLILTNAIYFKGKWESQFDPKNTKNMPFYVSENVKIETPTMYQKARFNYGEDEEVQILEIPYAGKDLSMVVILPKPNISLSKIERTLSAKKLKAWLSLLSEKEVEVYIPRFKIEKRYVLNEVLKKLGMVDAFDMMKADFSGMTPKPDLYITSVIHQSFVEVNEEGTEAAAATAVIMGTKAVIMPIVFRADRPFVFFVRDKRSESILFMGRLAEPGNK